MVEAIPIAERRELTVSYRTLDTPIGALLVAATEAGVVRIAFGTADEDAVLGDLAARLSARIEAAPGRVDALARQLDEYFSRRRRVFELPVDLRLARGFRRRVLERLREVPFGTTISYGALAAAVGSRAVRAAGSACATNPVPIVVPCHRVVRGDGSIGNYGGGVACKAALLELESQTAGTVPGAMRSHPLPADHVDSLG